MHRCRVFLLVLACLLGAVFAQTTGFDPCEPIEVECVGEGDSCTLTTNCGRGDNDPCPACKDDTTCLSGTCRDIVSKGDACSNSAGPVCGNSDGEEPHVNSCVAPGNLCGTTNTPYFAGDPCSTTDELITSASTNGGCTGVMCESSICEFKSANANCTSALECAQGLGCISGKCATWLTSGDCISDFDCAPSHACHLATPTGQPTCTAILSIADGGDADCAQTAQLQEGRGLASLMCQAGLACVAGKCEAIIDRTGDSCTGDADCNTGNPANSFTCFDDPCSGDSTCFPLVNWADSDVADAFKAYRNCLTSSNCNRLSLPWTSDSNANCAEENCRDEYNDLVDAWGDTPGACGSAYGLAPVLFVAIAAVFIALF